MTPTVWTQDSNRDSDSDSDGGVILTPFPLAPEGLFVNQGNEPLTPTRRKRGALIR